MTWLLGLLLFSLLTPGHSSLVEISCSGLRSNFCSLKRPVLKGDSAPSEEFYSLVFRNAILVDGSGTSSYLGDLAVIADNIAAVGQVNDSLVHPDHTEVILGGGIHFLAPGFIDSHTHDDVGVLANPAHTLKTYQGVTTVVVGNCGFSPYPNGRSLELVRQHLRSLLGEVDTSFFHQDFTSYAQALTGQLGVNVASLVGHGPLRISVMGYENRPATETEILVMSSLLDIMLTQGSVGMSLGLVYPPSAYADMAELVSLAKVLARHNKTLTAHVRSYEGKLLESVQEFLDVLRESGAKGLLSHLQVAGRPYWNTMMDQALQMIVDARAEGVDVVVDMYPYLAGSSTILQLLPPSSQAGGFEEFLEKLDDPLYLLELRELTETGREEGWESKINLIGYENVVIGSVVHHELKAFEGKTLVEGAEMLDVTEFDCLLYLVVIDLGRTNVIMFQQSQEDNHKVFQFQWQMVGSDSIPREGGKPHPRGYGSFPRVVGRMVKDNVLDLELAVRKTSALTAQRFGFRDRGMLRLGMKADLVMFDETFLDLNSYEEPDRPPTGVRGVWVNGARVIEDGRELNVFPGQVVYSDLRGI